MRALTSDYEHPVVTQLRVGVDSDLIEREREIFPVVIAKSEDRAAFGIVVFPVCAATHESL